METRPKSFPGFLWQNFLQIQGPLLWLITFSLAILFRIFPLKQSLSLDWIIPAFLALLVVILTVGKATYELFQLGFPGLPKLILVKESRIGDQPPTFHCVLEPSELFSYGITVAFYYDDGNFETLIGVGIVEHIREDRRIQVQIIAPAEGYEELLDRVKRNDSEVVRNVTVKPHVPQSYLTFPEQVSPQE
jgi:hypothetical protein